MHQSKIIKQRLMGGFFEIALPTLPIQENMAEHWGLPTDAALRFSNARSALAMLASAIQPNRAWVPAYVCNSIIEALNASSVPIAYYAVGDALEPDVLQLDRECLAGDMVLAVNYFGQAPNKTFRDFVRKRDDLIFIEDCAQTIDTGRIAWGNWKLISPRKVVGVADGGYIIPCQITKHKLKPSIPNSEIEQWIASLLRFEDEDDSNNLHWHSVNQQREKAMTVSDARMSRLSYELLRRLDAPAIIKQRKSNFIMLYKKLSHLAFIPVSTPDFCPFGFPIRLPNNLRTILNGKLINMGIFPAIHWPTLPSPSDQFEKEHLLAKELLTLPCDHRYSSSEMEYLASSVLDILRKNS